MATKLPDECLLEIFKYIDEKSLYSLLLVNRTWCRISISLLWKKPFKENQTNEHFKVILPLISYLDKEIRNSLKIEENNKTKTNNIQEKPTFNYVSFIKELDYTNMCYQAITCLKKLRNNPKDYSIMNDNYLYYGMMQIFEQNSYHVIKHEIENILNVKNDEWSNSLELTFNDLNFVDNLKDFPLLNLKFLKLDWDTLNFNHLQSQENEFYNTPEFSLEIDGMMDLIDILQFKVLYILGSVH
ncbi:hypothetical protein GLOIN_2v722955 [Rhizophagus irregularis DAOM 181602=DAOM 197198]|nr:hypothetical protein GLOIN_2v722955 [Rhizophagus irregularis DAOM 181602=DAOM 197198]